MISLLTFGGMDLRDDAGRELESVLRGPKQLALLAYLATATPRGFHRRDTLLALFWPELDQDRARRSLRQTLYQLRHTFGAGEAIQNRGEEEITLAEGALWCDAAAFEDHLDEGRLEKALELYRGEFLKGFHLSGCGDLERWLEETRARLRQRAVTAAWQLSDQYASTGDGAEAVRWAEWVMALIPTDEGAFHRLAVLLDQLGDRSNALQAYEELVTRLRDEYEVDPSPETAALIEKIRARKEANGIPVQQRIIQPEHVGPSQQDAGQLFPTDGAKVRAARNGRSVSAASSVMPRSSLSSSWRRTT
jgi:DNA-binding SARP family transcriptional activator